MNWMLQGETEDDNRLKNDDNHKNSSEEEPNRSILLDIIAQLKMNGMDLHRVSLPTFILEPRSMCERISDFMSHQDIILHTGSQSDPILRFLDVVKYFLSGWHIRPKGPKKPYNPVLGEFFRCQWTFPDGTQSFFVCEQTQHHPPMSTYYYGSPENGISIRGDLHPKARFLGNSAATLMKGGSYISFAQWPGELYELYNPNVYARGILFGTMFIEYGDVATIRCAASDLVCTIDFKTKGLFSSECHLIDGKVKVESTGQVLYKLHGKWSETMYIKTPEGESTEFFTVSEPNLQKVVPEKQEEFESRRLWQGVSNAILSQDIAAATESKCLIEETQRLNCRDREVSGSPWESRFFSQISDEGFELKLSDPSQKSALVDFIYSGPSQPMHSSFWRPE